MSILSNLKPQKGSRSKRKRLGRGESSGQGKTSGRGNKGQRARSGASIRPGFEGGQMPLARRLPKFGFFSRCRKTFNVVNVGHLAEIAAALETNTLDLALLMENKVFKKPMDGLKILGEGEIAVALTVKATKFSESAKQKIEAAGGKAEVV